LDKKISIESLNIDYQKVEYEILEFIRKIIGETRAKGVIVGLSGGIDSSVVVILCVKALGPEKVVGLIMPDSKVTPPSDIKDAESLAVKLGIKTYTVPIDSITRAFFKNIPLKKDRIAKANIRARIRMTINYFFANFLKYLVVGTGDKSENLIGYFTKYGDGGIDFLPIAHLYKTQVKKLGEYLGLGKNIIDKPSSPQLWRGQRATDEIPADYDILDLVLYAIFDLGMDHKKIASQLNVHLKLIQEVQRRYNTSKHKREYPSMLINWI